MHMTFMPIKTIVEIGRVENVMEEYHAIFAERMIQRPAVQPNLQYGLFCAF